MMWQDFLSEHKNGLGKTELRLKLGGMNFREMNQYMTKILDLISESPGMEKELLVRADNGIKKYSKKNQLLIMLQKPDASRLRTYQGWKTEGKHPEGKDIAVYIRAPVTPTKKELEEGADPEDIKGYFIIKMFDISDTRKDDQAKETKEENEIKIEI